MDLPGKKKRGRKRQSKPPEYSDSEDEARRETRPSYSKPRSRPSVTSVTSKTTESEEEARPYSKARPRPSINSRPSESGSESTWKRNKSDSESSVDVKKPPVTCYRSSSEDSVKIEESPPKLDVESVPKQDKKKSDTLRKLWGGKGAGKGGKDKGGKGKAGGGVIIVEQRSPAPAATSERVPSPVETKPPPTHIPSIEYTPAGRPILMCSISLSKIFHVPSPSKRRSEEMRINTELADTRQDEKKERKSKHRKPGPASLTNGSSR